MCLEMYFNQSIYLTIYLCVCLSFSLSLCLSVSFSLSISLSLSLCLSLSLPFSLALSLSLSLSRCPRRTCFAAGRRPTPWLSGGRARTSPATRSAWSFVRKRATMMSWVSQPMRRRGGGGCGVGVGGATFKYCVTVSLRETMLT